VAKPGLSRGLIRPCSSEITLVDTVLGDSRPPWADPSSKREVERFERAGATPRVISSRRHSPQNARPVLFWPTLKARCTVIHTSPQRRKAPLSCLRWAGCNRYSARPQRLWWLPSRRRAHRARTCFSHWQNFS